MILMLSPWHIVILLALFVGWYAAIVSTGIILLLHGVYRQIERENTGWEQVKREKRSAAAKQGHVTRRAKTLDLDDYARKQSERQVLRANGVAEDEVERVLRQLDAQARAKQIVQRGEDQ